MVTKWQIYYHLCYLFRVICYFFGRSIGIPNLRTILLRPMCPCPWGPQERYAQRAGPGKHVPFIMVFCPQTPCWATEKLRVTAEGFFLPNLKVKFYIKSRPNDLLSIFSPKFTLPSHIPFFDFHNLTFWWQEKMSPRKACQGKEKEMRFF